MKKRKGLYEDKLVHLIHPLYDSLPVCGFVSPCLRKVPNRTKVTCSWCLAEKMMTPDGVVHRIFSMMHIWRWSACRVETSAEMCSPSALPVTCIRCMAV